MYELRKITIRKLLNRHDVEIDLTEGCRVLIGANGTGKTASLKILHCILTGNYADISELVFDSIEAEVYVKGEASVPEPSSGKRTGGKRKQTVSFRYRDCFPGIKYILKRYYEIPEYNQFLEEFYYLLTELEENGLYEAFLSCLYKKCEYPYNVEQYVEKYMGGYNSNFLSLGYDLREPDIVRVKEGWPFPSFSEPVRYFEGSDFEQTSMFAIADGIRRPVYYFDLVRDYRIDNTIFHNSQFISKKKEWAYSDPQQLSEFPDIKRTIDLSGAEAASFQITEKVPEECEEELEKDHSLDLNRLINAGFFKAEICTDINRISSEYTKRYYDELDHMTKDEKRRLLDEKENIEAGFTKEIKELYAGYIRPVLVRHSFFDRDMYETVNMDWSAFPGGDAGGMLPNIPEELLYELGYLSDETPKTPEKTEEDAIPLFPDGDDSFMNISDSGLLQENPFSDGAFTEDNEDRDSFGEDELTEELPFGTFSLQSEVERVFFRKMLLAFIRKVSPIVRAESSQTKKIRDLRHVLEKYMIDRMVMICPAGCFIKNREKGERDRIWSIYDDRNLDLSWLSSGERKLILLFAVGIFFNKTILMDEPELSLSLVWQEMLLPDILSVSDSTIVCATHSPYIVNDESVQKYIRYIP